MTEIPEHLLKRAAERRAAMTGGSAAADEPAAAAAPAAGDASAVEPAAPAAKAAPAPLPTLDAEPAKPKTVPAVVAAANRRKRVPFWAASVLAFLPVWGILYINSMQPPPAGEGDPLAIGAEVFANDGCAGCHLGNGAGVAGGGTGQQLNEGHVLATFNDPLDMVHWIAFGYEGGKNADGTYGKEEIRQRINGSMPKFDDKLTPEEIAAVTIYIRESLSGGKPEDDPNFNVETFEADPEKLAKMVEEVIALGPGGDKDTSTIEGAETEG